MALYVTRPRRDEVRIGRGLPSANGRSPSRCINKASQLYESALAYPFIKREWFKKQRQEKSLLFCYELNKC